jgi:HNH endonuclease
MSADHSTTPPVTYKPVPGFEDYRVGDDGSVWSRRTNKRPFGVWRRLAATPEGRGYSLVILCSGTQKKAFKVHTLVLTLFVGPCPPGMEACHNDGNRTNSRLDNLRWDTPKANAADKIKHGTNRAGSSNPNAKLTEADVAEIRRLAPISRHIDLARRFGVSDVMIGHIVLGRCWKSSAIRSTS